MKRRPFFQEMQDVEDRRREAKAEQIKQLGREVTLGMAPRGPDLAASAKVFSDAVAVASKKLSEYQITWTVNPTIAVVPVLPLDLAKLDVLKSAEPYRPLRPAPDRIEVITGWRAWKVRNSRLFALAQSTPWEPKEKLVATCQNGWGSVAAARSDGHEAPQLNCQCGIWAFKTLDVLTQALGKYSDIHVLGKVALWGRVIETENGYRAQFAYPSELWLLNDSLEELSWVYDVPIRKTA